MPGGAVIILGSFFFAVLWYASLALLSFIRRLRTELASAKIENALLREELRCHRIRASFMADYRKRVDAGARSTSTVGP